jgi:phosphopantetheine adenylyltransferase
MESEADMAKLRVGVYPGTFDPITKGHLDIMSRPKSNRCAPQIVKMAAA